MAKVQTAVTSALLTAVLALALWGAASAQVLAVGSVRIHTVADVEGYYSRSGGETYLCFPGTRDYRLAGTDAAAFPMDPEAVVEAVAGLGYPLEGIDIDILILPEPRRDLPNSSAEGRVIFLSPGRVQHPVDHVHYTVVHEIGHVVQHALMPRSRNDLWQAYAEIRGLPSAGTAPGSSHAERISEIFAEDFRVLFGGSRARCGGVVENHEISSPESIDGLRQFMLSLRDEWRGRLTLAASPNPFESSVVLRAFSLDEPVHFDVIEIYDARGRCVRKLAPVGAMEVVWDGRDQAGVPVAPGMYLLAGKVDSRLHVYKLMKVSR